MKCELIQSDLKAYRDAELPIVRRLALRRHLSGCAVCREELKTMEKIADTLQFTETSEPLTRDLRTRILAEAAKQGKPSAISPQPGGKGSGGGEVRRRRLSPAWVAGICAVVAIAAFFAMQPHMGVVQLAGGHVGPSAVGSSPLALQYSPVPPADKAVSVGRLRASQVAASPQIARETFAGGGPPPHAPAVGYGDANSLVTRRSALAPASAAMAQVVNGNALDATTLSLDRQVHREASVTVETKDPEASSDQVSDMAKSAGGYVASNNLSTDDGGMKTAELDLKVPVAQFDTVLGQVEKLGNVTAKNVTGEDITGKVSDAGQAEAVLDDEVNRSNAHLAAMGRHAKWEDEDDARELRIELAQARARVQLLHKLAQLSDISVTLNQTPKPAPPAQTGFMNNLRGNGSAAFQSMLGTMSALLTMLIWILAYIPIWGPIAFAVWYALRFRRSDARPSGA